MMLSLVACFASGAVLAEWRMDRSSHGSALACGRQPSYLFSFPDVELSRNGCSSVERDFFPFFLPLEKCANPAQNRGGMRITKQARSHDTQYSHIYFRVMITDLSWKYARYLSS